MHSQSILRPTVENSNVMCHDAWLVEGRLRNGKKERCKGSLLEGSTKKENPPQRADAWCPPYDDGHDNQIATAYFYAFAIFVVGTPVTDCDVII